MQYEKINVNPMHKKTGDCSVRAVATGTELSWNVIYRLLSEVGFMLKCMPNSKEVVEAYLLEEGWKKYKMPRHPDGTKFTVKELVEDNEDRTLIMQIANHFTVSVKGKLIDTWDCSKKSVYNYYSKPN